MLRFYPEMNVNITFYVPNPTYNTLTKTIIFDKKK